MTLRVHSSRALALGSALIASLSGGLAQANAVTDWSGRAAVAVNEQIPMEQSRSLAIIQIAIHDALNAIDQRYAPYAFQGSARHASPEAAVATAARDALVATLTKPNPDLDTWYREALAKIPNGEAKRRGVEIGRSAAERIVSLRHSDDVKGALNKPYTPGAGPGAYQVTPPFDFIIGAGWGEIPTFVTRQRSAFRPESPMSLTGFRYARDYQEVQALGKKESTLRTPEQTQIADFWYESSATGWHRIAGVVIQSQNLDLWESARVYGLVSLALADGFINGFDAKYYFNYWRPITAIRAGDSDGNRRTVGDASWTPYCATPPVADYPSTHSVLGAAAAAVLARAFGDHTPFTIDSLTLPGVKRSFKRFSQAAQENADSRVYCGIHWRSSTEAGVEQGRRIGQFVFEAALRPRKKGH